MPMLTRLKFYAGKQTDSVDKLGEHFVSWNPLKPIKISSS